MKYTITEFAREIRKLYPGEYDDLKDKKLVKLWLKKYPEDLKKVDFTNESRIKSKSRKEGKQETIIYHRSNWMSQLLFALVIFILFISFLKNPSSNDFTKELEFRYNEKFKNELKQEGLIGGIFGMFSTALDYSLNSDYKRSDLLFFSIFYRKVENSAKVTAIGFWDNFFFLEDPFITKTENSNSFKKPKICENTEESLRELLSRPEERWGRQLIMEDLSITQDVNGISWKIIDNGPNKYEAEAIYMADDKTFTIVWFH